jgi:hypothetical protein
MSNNWWMPEDLRGEWDRAKEEAEAARERVESASNPEEWTDAQHELFASIVDKAREKSKSGERMTKEEAAALKAYLKNPDVEYQRIKADIANRREEATPDVRYDESSGTYYDRFGRECDSNGNRY